MLFLTVLFGIVLVLLAFALMKDRGQHTEYARRNQPKPQVSSVKPTESAGRVAQLH